MDPRIKKLDAEVENYTRAVAKREKQIEHFKDIIKDRKTRLSSLKKPAKKPIKKKAKPKAKPKVKAKPKAKETKTEKTKTEKTKTEKTKAKGKK